MEDNLITHIFYEVVFIELHFYGFKFFLQKKILRLQKILTFYIDRKLAQTGM